MKKLVRKPKKHNIDNTHTKFTGGCSNNYDREEHDFYATPPKDVKKFLDEYTKIYKLGYTLEPACGMGHISNLLSEYTNKIDCMDIVDRGVANAIIDDFLKHKFKSKYDTIITNPPFKYAQEFIDKSLSICNGQVIMLLKVQFLESLSRKDWLKNSPLKYVYVNSERVNCWRGGEEKNPNTGKSWSGAMLLCWFVFEVGYTGEPIIRWI